jgi:hypothetical protein
MPSDDNLKITDGEINSLVEKHKRWMGVQDWELYLLSRKQNYIFDRVINIGLEYQDNKLMWDNIFEMEWVIMEERLNAGLGVEQDILNKFGEDFFKSKDELLNEVKEITEGLDSMDYKDNNNITIYTFEDFNLLSNQGIFRDSVFILNPQRKWKKKVVSCLRDYGYRVVEVINMGGEKYFFVSKEEA